jgi:hypothetical protein
MTIEAEKSPLLRLVTGKRLVKTLAEEQPLLRTITK